MNYRPPSMMTLEEYIEYDKKTSIIENWEEKIDEQTEEGRPFELPTAGNPCLAEGYRRVLAVIAKAASLWPVHLSGRCI